METYEGRLIQLHSCGLMDKTFNLGHHATDIWMVDGKEQMGDNKKYTTFINTFTLSTKNMDIHSKCDIIFCDTLLFEMKQNFEGVKTNGAPVNLHVPIEIRRTCGDSPEEPFSMISQGNLFVSNNKAFIMVNCNITLNTCETYTISFHNVDLLGVIDRILFSHQINVAVDIIGIVDKYCFVPLLTGVLYVKTHFVLKGDYNKNQDLTNYVPRYVDNREMRKFTEPTHDLLEISVSQHGVNVPRVCYHQQIYAYSTYYIRKTDIDKINSVFYFVGEEFTVCFDTWLKTRNVTHEGDFNLVILPFPPIPSSSFQNQRILINFKPPYRDEEIKIYYTFSLYSKEKHRLDTSIPSDSDRLIVQFQQLPDLTYVRGIPSTRLRVDLKHCITVLYFVLMCNGEPCKYLDMNPFKKLLLYVNNRCIYQGDNDYFSQVVPIMFGKPLNNLYMTYQAIFHNTPFCQPYDTQFMNKSAKEYLAGTTNMLNQTTVYASRILNFEIEVKWDMNALQTYFKDSDIISLKGYAENVNIGRFANDVFYTVFAS